MEAQNELCVTTCDRMEKILTNFKFIVQYDGTKYDGLQKQGNTSNTIQGKIERVIAEMVGHGVEVHASSRTDAGVHAKGQVMHCKLNTEMTAIEIKKYCNKYLPSDIAIVDCSEIDIRFHSRLNSSKKQYIYRIWNSDVPNVFERKYMCTVENTLDAHRMNEAAGYLLGTHDFAAFFTNKRYKKSTVRTITNISVQRNGDEVQIACEGTGFLYNMMRIIVGTLIEVGHGKRKPEDIIFILDSKDRANAGITMPPHGLCLEKVEF